MTNIRDFTPGTSEQRGAITVKRYPDPAAPAPFNYEHEEYWRFAVELAKTDEVWIRLHTDAVYGDDDTILTTVATELLQMAATSRPDAVLADGRKLTGLKAEDLWHAAG